MNDKIQNLKDLEYYSSYITCTETISKWLKAKPDNDELKAVSQGFIDICFYVNTLQQELRLHKQAISEYRSDKIRAIERARRSEKELEKTEKALNNIKKIQKDYEIKFIRRDNRRKSQAY